MLMKIMQCNINFYPQQIDVNIILDILFTYRLYINQNILNAGCNLYFKTQNDT